MTEVTRAEAAEILGYSPSSMAAIMRRQPDRWPKPVGTRRMPSGATALVYDLDQMRSAAGGTRPAPSELTGAASLSDDDGLITCLNCERRFRFLAPHLRHAHGQTPDEYRAEHRLPKTASMQADVLRLTMREIRLEMLAEDPTSLDHLKRYHAAEYTRELAQRAADAVRESHTIPLAREHRAPGRAYAVQRMVEQRLAKLDAAAREHGYQDVDDAVRSTLHLSARAAARATGLSPQTITRRRADLPQA